MAQLLLQGLKLLLGIVVVTLKACHLNKLVIHLAGLTVILEARLQHALLEVGIVSVREMELCGWRYRRMTRYIVKHISQCHLGRVQSALAQIYSDVGNRIGLHLHVGLYAAAVAYGASAASLELMCQRVRYVLLVSTSGVLVVYCLYASAAGYVILGHRKFERSIMRQFHGLLHQSLTVGACAHHHGAVQVLQRTARYLACRRCVAVH